MKHSIIVKRHDDFPRLSHRYIVKCECGWSEVLREKIFASPYGQPMEIEKTVEEHLNTVTFGGEGFEDVWAEAHGGVNETL